MAKWIVKRTCHGFKGRYWEEGTIVELEDDVNPPNHFERYDSKKIKITEKTEIVDPMKPEPSLPGQPPIAKAGFAAGADNLIPQKPLTAGEALKDDKGEKENPKAKNK